ncbi:16S rRNA (guanine(527)-N(7))-methyltransferase RsmG [Oceanirhabdus sp. W0125-5]|uniref:16S rRNA (guanine(527)-N(7))-methyltransferase RsmG n=1 Tax=Oceanirhabdus sp. W0125-5 TaxID=2999116 RepID=UPI0022F32B22|nr:16S rRNA (guanine(527)-N(7))-methyltransferase RsmG [Oceanirhabdus sp. W0125-5]WBW97613.1 16S rRNA (guanine(527)-N(7))-methyltransferase RsmG [Oceanirhabdus sp. W0125-5]
MEYYKLFEKACADVDIEFNEDMYNKFMKYKELIKEWNKKVNLTAITEDEEIIKKHFIDSIKVLKNDGLKQGNKVIDIGTGGGFPGIPLKIVLPEIKITLLDSLNKRINFLNLVIEELGLKNVETIHGRAEDFGQNPKYREKYDYAVSRAVANLTALSEFCIPFVKVNGKFLAMKGPAVEDEINDSKKAINVLGGELKVVDNVIVEGSDLNHNLVCILKKKATPKKYPRKAGMVTKNPIK